MYAKTYTNPISFTSQFPFCGLPLRLDTYAGCAFRCNYCFARYRGGNTFGETVRPASSKRIGRYFFTAFDSAKSRVGLLAQCLRQRVPVHFGGMSDPFQPAELRYRATETVLRLLAKYNYPTVISTKSDLVATKPYLGLLQEIEHTVIQFSFSSTNDRVAQRFEPYSSPPSRLLRAMEILANRGINVTCRWQPYIPNVSESPSEFIPRAASTGCKHIALEHLKLPVEQQHPLWNDLTQAAGRNLNEEYRRLGAYLDGRELILPAHTKLETVVETSTVARKHGLTFGAADNEFQYMSDTACCCSGVDQFPGFENWFKHQIGYAIRQTRGKEITYDSIEQEWYPSGSIDRYLNSNSRLSRKGKSEGSVRDHILWRWNNPGTNGSPSSFYAVEPTSEISTNGQRIYRWSSQRGLGDTN